MQEHINALYELTARCRCTGELCDPKCPSQYTEHVDALVDEINRLNGTTAEDERRRRDARNGEPRSKFPNLPEPSFCGFACFRNRHHRGLHQWEAHRRGFTVAQWRAHLAETDRPAACILDAGLWTERRDPCD